MHYSEIITAGRMQYIARISDPCDAVLGTGEGAPRNGPLRRTTTATNKKVVASKSPQMSTAISCPWALKARLGSVVFESVLRLARSLTDPSSLMELVLLWAPHQV